MKISYISIPLIVFSVLGIGYFIAQSGMEWYHTELLLPETVPPDWVFSVAWNLIGVLTSLSIIIFWHTSRDRLFAFITALFGINGLLNISWVVLFFWLNFIGKAYWVAVFLAVNLILLITLLLLCSWKAALLLIHYALWVGCMIYLNYEL